MRLVDLIAKRTGHDLTPATVFLHPTPRDLATHLAANPSSPAAPPTAANPTGTATLTSAATAASPAGPTGTATPTSAASLIPLTADLGRPSLTLIHAIGGTVFDYVNLAADLTGTFAVYGLQAPGLHPIPPSSACHHRRPGHPLHRPAPGRSRRPELLPRRLVHGRGPRL